MEQREQTESGQAPDGAENPVGSPIEMRDRIFVKIQALFDNIATTLIRDVQKKNMPNNEVAHKLYELEYQLKKSVSEMLGVEFD